jgi:flavin reductase (DIM6/NTAB) family NADH-FMN oxidoreductase RutF/rubredoxin
MKKWKCTVCGYIHTGDSLPNECPECGVGPELFELLEENVVDNTEAMTDEEKDAAKKAIYKISYGLYVVTSKDGEKINGQVCNTVFQITSDPIRIAIGINKGNLTGEFILESGVFNVHVLGIEGHPLVRRFGYRSGRDLDKFKGLDYTLGKTGAPIINSDQVVGYLECKVLSDKILDCGTHNLIVADVIGGKGINNTEPMTYDYFRKTK